MTKKPSQKTQIIATGLMLGLLTGVALDNVGLWLPLGLCLGVALSQTKARADR